MHVSAERNQSLSMFIL